VSHAQVSGYQGSGMPWWHGAVVYQLYVRSWRDSNDDGYGDLRGIIDRLDYLAWLGADAIWLSPTMPSPDDDWGYDVSDYTGVHPELGTLADLDELIAQAGRRGMRVLLDLVPNHTSSEHPWFADAASSRQAAHRSYYVWADGRPDGGPPTNWLDFTGHPAWQWHDSGVYRNWRKIAESYSPERLLLGETWVPDAQGLAAYYGDNDELQLGFNFPFAFSGFQPARLAAIVEQTLAALPPGACPVWMGSNHDLGRFPSRWCDQPASLPPEAGEVLLTTSAEQTPPSPGVLRPWEGVITTAT